MSENIYGIHAVNSILANSPERLIEVFVLKICKSVSKT